MEAPNIIVATPGIENFAQRIHERIRSVDKDSFAYSGFKKDVFANGEIKSTLKESVRKKEVYLFHGFESDPNIGYMELFIAIDALSRASASSISIMLPYMPYQRQDRKDEPRAPITASLIAEILQLKRCVTRIGTMDLHAGQIQGYYAIPVDDLGAATTVFKEYWRQELGDNLGNVVVVSPDASGTGRARKFAKAVGIENMVGFMDKMRTGVNHSESLGYAGPRLQDMRVIIYDDMIDTGGSTAAAIGTAVSQGAARVYACSTHGIFSKKKGIAAEDTLRATGARVVVTESIQRSPEYQEQNKDWLSIIPLDLLFANAIYNDAVGTSISKMLQEYHEK